eukprot:sb/3469450/
MLSLLALLALSATCATGQQQVQEFGDTIDASSVLAVQSYSVRTPLYYIPNPSPHPQVQSYSGAVGVSPQIREFEIISGGSNGDGLYLQVEIPVPQQNDTSSEHSIFVIDFTPFSATSNPIVNDTIDPSLLSNCSNILEPAPLSSYFQTEADTDSTVPATTSVPFYAVRQSIFSRCQSIGLAGLSYRCDTDMSFFFCDCSMPMSQLELETILVSLTVTPSNQFPLGGVGS